MSTELEQAKLFFQNGLDLIKAENFVNAELALRKAYDLMPDRPSILANLSATLIAQHKWLEAEQFCRELLLINPEDVEGLINLGAILSNINQPDNALDCLNKAIELNPKAISAWINRKANCLLEQNKIHDACRCFNQALDLNPTSTEALIGMGNAVTELRDYDLGLDYFSQALAINPDNPLAKWNKSLSLLRLGVFNEGWKLYESRWEVPGMKEHVRKFSVPLWLGQDQVRNKTILVYAEQGYGDAIQFCRYIPILERDLGAKVIFEVPRALVDLMKSLSPFTEIIERESLSFQELESRIDYYCPIMSLPLAFNTSLNTIPKKIPYLSAESYKREFWEHRLKNTSGSLMYSGTPFFRVGITWSGSGHYAGKKNTKRDIPFNQILELIKLSSNQFVEFHAITNEHSNKWANQASELKNFFFHQQFIQNFADSAALISCLDYVVSIDTAVAHLSGAMGKESLLLLPEPPDFISLIGTTHSPWYPSIQVLRQDSPGIWPLEKISRAIIDKSTEFHKPAS